MRFIQPCFIRKYSDELIKKLSDLGYHTAHCGSGYTYIECAGRWATANSVLYEEDLEGYIDCGTNEELFLALAAMTDEPCNPIEYYKVTTSCGTYEKGQVTQLLPLMSNIHPSCYRKATAQEIIEHFTEKEEQK